ncbi:MAG: phospholipase D-like domain-containing protein [Acidimicrobiales bacterium]
MSEAVARAGRPADAWRRFAASLTLAVGDDGLLAHDDLEQAVKGLRPGLAAGQLLAAAEDLGVIARGAVRVGYSPAAAEDVARALDLAGSSLTPGPQPASWTPVGTVPEQLRRRVVIPGLRQTAGVLLDIIDHARERLWMTAPFIERTGINFLADAIVGAVARDVAVVVITSPNMTAHGAMSTLLVRAEAERFAGLTVIEVETETSELGSHAKVCLADDEVCYLGSANLTAHGLGRHLELGARLYGPDVAIVRAALEAIAALGHRVYPRQ